MRKRRYEQWLSLSQMGAIIGLMIGLVWNILGLFMESAPAWWILALLPLPGGLSWLVARLWPTIYPKLVHRERQNFRLTYDVSAAWDDVGLRQSLLTMIQTGTEAIDVVWARDGHEFGCWILFGGCCPDVFERILEDMVPGGTLEADSAPEVGAGVVMLRWDTALLDRNGAV
ncbi:MAG: hypothetical protein GY934_10115, partial [Gammaproteobacteria bacterium]|nr:hypothetical protein [Gammaproteobacteria bacterium]